MMHNLAQSQLSADYLLQKGVGANCAMHRVSGLGGYVCGGRQFWFFFLLFCVFDQIFFFCAFLPPVQKMEKHMFNNKCNLVIKDHLLIEFWF